MSSCHNDSLPLQVAKNNEVMVAISNRNLAGRGNMLDLWMRNVKRAGVTNAFVVALDEETKAHADKESIASMVMDVKAFFLHLPLTLKQLLHPEENCARKHSKLLFWISQQIMLLIFFKYHTS